MSQSTNLIFNGGNIPAARGQSDWAETNPQAESYIKNKPTIPAPQTQSNWEQTNETAVDFIKNKPLLVAEYGTTTYAQVRQFALYAGKTAICKKQLLTAVLIAEDGSSFKFATPPNVKGQYHVFTLNNDDSWTDETIERTHDLICQLKPIVITGQTSMRHILCDRQKYIIEQGVTVFQPVDVYQLAVWINRGDIIQIDGASASDPWGDRYPLWITEVQCQLDNDINKYYCANIGVRGYAYSPTTELERWGDNIEDETTHRTYLEFQNWF